MRLGTAGIYGCAIAGLLNLKVSQKKMTFGGKGNGYCHWLLNLKGGTRRRLYRGLILPPVLPVFRLFAAIKIIR